MRPYAARHRGASSARAGPRPSREPLLRLQPVRLKRRLLHLPGRRQRVRGRGRAELEPQALEQLLGRAWMRVGQAAEQAEL
jgi:hypothetical protein